LPQTAAFLDRSLKLDDLSGPSKFPDRFVITEAVGNSSVQAILNFLAKAEERNKSLYRSKRPAFASMYQPKTP